MNINIDKQIANTFSMTDTVWERHANLWSVWTRFIILPFIVLAVWSRVWIGWWAIAPFLMLLLWTWINPRIFPKPSSTNNWASKAVLGERVWLNREQIPIPVHHEIMAKTLSLVSGVGLPFLVWGLLNLTIWPTLLGVVLVYAGKMWFLDRMVWLYEDMKGSAPEYQGWLY
ncbi:MAG: DUF6653 family protein [Coleofasciculaceae cyanobacterium]